MGLTTRRLVILMIRTQKDRSPVGKTEPLVSSDKKSLSGGQDCPLLLSEEKKAFQSVFGLSGWSLSASWALPLSEAHLKSTRPYIKSIRRFTASRAITPNIKKAKVRRRRRSGKKGGGHVEPQGTSRDWAPSQTGQHSAQIHMARIGVLHRAE